MAPESQPTKEPRRVSVKLDSRLTEELKLGAEAEAGSWTNNHV